MSWLLKPTVGLAVAVALGVLSLRLSHATRVSERRAPRLEKHVSANPVAKSFDTWPRDSLSRSGAWGVEA
jgi:hypothetical protein